MRDATVDQSAEPGPKAALGPPRQVSVPRGPAVDEGKLLLVLVHLTSARALNKQRAIT